MNSFEARQLNKIGHRLDSIPMEYCVILISPGFISIPSANYTGDLAHCVILVWIYSIPRVNAPMPMPMPMPTYVYGLCPYAHAYAYGLCPNVYAYGLCPNAYAYCRILSWIKDISTSLWSYNSLKELKGLPSKSITDGPTSNLL